MAKKTLKPINSISLIGNVFISMSNLGKTELSKQEIYSFINKLDSLLHNDYYIYFNNSNDFNDFCEDYDFLVEKHKDVISLKEGVTPSSMTSYFRIGIAKPVIETCDNIAKELVEKDQIENDSMVLKRKVKA